MQLGSTFLKVKKCWKYLGRYYSHVSHSWASRLECRCTWKTILQMQICFQEGRFVPGEGQGPISTCCVIWISLIIFTKALPNSDNKEQATTNHMHCQCIKGPRKYARWMHAVNMYSVMCCQYVQRLYSRADSWLANIATSQSEISAGMKFYLPMRSVFADSFRD